MPSQKLPQHRVSLPLALVHVGRVCLGGSAGLAFTFLVSCSIAVASAVKLLAGGAACGGAPGAPPRAGRPGGDPWAASSSLRASREAKIRCLEGE